jgi:rhodanese-related sulfurtransferase
MTQPLRISAAETRQRVSTGSALLVCAYDDDEKFKNNHLQGAISLSEFKSRLPSIAKDQEVIFYCA